MIMIATPLGFRGFGGPKWNAFMKCINAVNNLDYPKEELQWVLCVESDYPLIDKLRELTFPCQTKILVKKPESPIFYRRITQARETLRKYFLQNDYTHFFALESDIIIPSDSLKRMIEFDQPVVTGVYALPPGSNRTQLFTRIGWDGKHWTGVSYYYFHTLPQEPFEAEGGITLSFTLLKREVLEKIEFRIPSGLEYIACDDVFFSIDMKKLGYKMWVLPDLIAGHEW